VRFAPGSGTVVVAGVSAGVATFSDLAGRFFAGGLMHSTDAGRTWAAADAPAGTDRSVFPHLRSAPAANALFAYALDYQDHTRSIGFLRSDDGGGRWVRLPDPLAGRNIEDLDVSGDGRTIYAHDRNTLRLMRSRDAGTSWSELAAPSNGVVALSPHDAALVLFDDRGTLRRSIDGLATFAIVLTSARRFDDIEFAPSDPRVVYAVTEGYDVYRSDDAGASFRLLVNLRATVLR
jgi:photosystem II stability/assembly factor-like uncharacterized protein